MPAVIRLSPIGDADTDRVAAFLCEQMDRPWPRDRWLSTIESPWPSVGPNRGFQLLDGKRVVGAYVAYYSEREIGGGTARVCNLGTWCVHPDHRSHGIRLVRALLEQEGYHFTDLSPSSTVIRLNSRLGFEPLDADRVAVPNLPWPPLPGRGTVSADPATVEQGLSGAELKLYRDHAGAAGARHLLLSQEGERCYVVVRRDTRRGVPVCTVLYVGNPDLFGRMSGTFARHLLLRHGAVAHLIDDPISPHRPWLSLRRPGSRRMYRSAHLEPSQLDYLYSELTCLP